MELGELKEWIRRTRPDLPGQEVIDLLVEGYRGEGTVCSPATLAERFAPGRKADVLATLLLLAGQPTNVLGGRWIFIDDKGEQFEVSPEEMAEVFGSGEFFHPLSGSQIYSCERVIGLIYEAGPGFPVVPESRSG